MGEQAGSRKRRGTSQQKFDRGWLVGSWVGTYGVRRIRSEDMLVNVLLSVSIFFLFYKLEVDMFSLNIHQLYLFQLYSVIIEIIANNLHSVHYSLSCSFYVCFIFIFKFES